MSKSLVIYHENCMDGEAAAWVTRKASVDMSTTYLGWQYGQEKLPNISGYTHIYIVDFSFPKTVLEDWSKSAYVEVIDHHKTAQVDLSNLAVSDSLKCHFDMNESGATLTWKRFFPNDAMPTFLSYIKDRDLWEWKLHFSREVSEAMWNLTHSEMAPEFPVELSRTFKVFDTLSKMKESTLQAFLAPLGYKLLEPKRKQIEELAEKAKQVSWKGYDFVAVEVPENQGRIASDLCAFLYTKYPEKDFVCSYFLNERKQYVLSFRSDKNGNNFDVSALAKGLGGGGHHNAAGATMSRLFWR